MLRNVTSSDHHLQINPCEKLIEGHGAWCHEWLHSALMFAEDDGQDLFLKTIMTVTEVLEETKMSKFPSDHAGGATSPAMLSCPGSVL